MKTTKQSSNFFQDVFELVRLIPAGRVTSYGAIATYLGQKGSARMVGWALNKSITDNHQLPAHRVVNRNGMLSGKMHFPTSTHMQEMLEKEGIKVEKDQIVNFHTYFWDPSVELL